MAARTVVWAPG